MIEYDKSKVNSLGISDKDKNFLIESGLPESAAPFMSFETINNGAFLKLNEKFNIDIEEKYIYIGFTGEGDILALENDTGRVVCINHENLEKIYINNTVSQLAESLLEYEKFIQEINNNNGEFAYLDKECSLEELNYIKEKLISIDIKSLQKNSFWSNELSLFNNYI